jgi:hypothetical protein|tara:strand:+ start:351 stop:1232 length:882 start_codon:yes stop_codon:yes gene_type:complete
MRNKIKHTKFRNTGLLYEFLLRQLTADVLSDKGNSVVKIVKKRFNENTELGKELALYNILLNKKFTSDKKADYFVNEVISARLNLNNSELRREKYNLINELKDTFNINKLFSSKIKNYKIYASIYKLFEYNNSLSPDDKTESHFSLVEHITTKKNTISLSENINKKLLPADEDLRILTYKTLLEKFNHKYTKLNLPQKSLLRAYINNVSNTNSLKEFIEKVVPVIKKELKQHSNKLQDKVVKIKLKEAIKNINSFCINNKSKTVKDSYVVQTMRYMELLKELKKSGNKNQKVI